MSKQISFEDFRKVDIRVGTVARAEVPKWSHWVLRLEVDFGGGIANEVKSAKDSTSRRVRIEQKNREARSGGGDELGIKTCFSGIMKFFKPEDLEGKQFPFVVNLEPKKVGPEKELSECMMLMAVEKEDEETPPVLFSLQKKVANGTRVY